MSNIILPFGAGPKKPAENYGDTFAMHMEHMQANVRKVLEEDKEASPDEAMISVILHETIRNRISLDRLFTHFGVKND